MSLDDNLLAILQYKKVSSSSPTELKKKYGDSSVQTLIYGKNFPDKPSHGVEKPLFPMIFPFSQHLVKQDSLSMN